MANNTSTNRLVLQVDGDSKGAAKSLREVEAASAKTDRNLAAAAQRLAHEQIASMGQVTEEGKRLVIARSEFEVSQSQRAGDRVKAILTSRLSSQKEFSSGWMATLREMDTVDATLARKQSDRIKAVEVQRKSMMRELAQAVHGAGGGNLAGGILSGASGLGSAAAIKADIDLVNTLTDKAAQFEKAQSRVNDVFGGGAAGVKDWADKADNALGLTKTRAEQAANSIGTVLKAAGVTGANQARLSEQLVGRAVDVASATGKDPNAVLKAFQNGLTGPARSLREFGVFLTDARIKAEAFDEGLVKSVKDGPKIAHAHEAVQIAVAKLAEAQSKYGKGSIEAAQANQHLESAQATLTKAVAGNNAKLTDGEKIQARVNLLLKDSATFAGNFANHADDAANAQSRLTAQTDKLEVALGEKLLPLKVEVLKFLNDMLEKFNSLDDSTKNFVLSVGGIGAVVAPLAAGVGNIVLQLLRIKGAYEEIKAAKIAADIAGGIPAVPAVGAAGRVGLLARGAAAAVGGGAVLAAPFVVAGVGMATITGQNDITNQNAINDAGRAPFVETAQERDATKDQISANKAKLKTLLSPSHAEKRRTMYGVAVSADEMERRIAADQSEATDLINLIASDKKTLNRLNKVYDTQYKQFQANARKVSATSGKKKADADAKAKADTAAKATKAAVDAAKAGASTTDTTGDGGLYSGAERNAAARKADSAKKKADAKAKREDEQKDALIARMSAQSDREGENELRLMEQTLVAEAQAQQEAREKAVQSAQNTLKILPNAKQIEALDTGKVAPDAFKKDLTKQITDAREALRKASLDLLEADKAENLAAYGKASARQPQDSDEAAAMREQLAGGQWQKANSAAYGRFNERNTQGDVDVDRNNKEVASALKGYAETVKQNTHKAAEVIKTFWQGEGERIDREMRQAEQQNDFATQNKLVQERLKNQIEEASQEFYLGLMEGDPAQTVAALNHFNQATSDAADAMAHIRDAASQAGAEAAQYYYGNAPDKQNRVDQNDYRASGSDRFIRDEYGNTYDRKRMNGAGDDLKRVDGDQVQFMQDLTQAASKGSDDFMRALFSGKKDQNTLKDIGKHMGQDFANAGADFLQRKLVDGPLNRLFDGIADHLQDALLKGGGAAGKAIGQAALALYDIYLLSGKAGRKKQRNAFAGALIGLGIGGATGNPLLGAQLGAGIAGSFADGGRYPVGRKILIGEEGPEVVQIDKPGEIIPNHRINLDALRDTRKLTDFAGFRDNAAALLGGGLTPMPKLSPAILSTGLRDMSAGASVQQLQAVVQEAIASGRMPGMSGSSVASGAPGDVSQSITIFGGVHGDGAAKRAGKAWGSSLQDAIAMR